MRVCGKDIKIQGRLVRIASPELDSYELLNDPEAVLDGLRKPDSDSAFAKSLAPAVKKWLKTLK